MSPDSEVSRKIWLYLVVTAPRMSLMSAARPCLSTAFSPTSRTSGGSMECGAPLADGVRCGIAGVEAEPPAAGAALLAPGAEGAPAAGAPIPVSALILSSFPSRAPAVPAEQSAFRCAAHALADYLQE